MQDFLVTLGVLAFFVCGGFALWGMALLLIKKPDDD